MKKTLLLSSFFLLSVVCAVAQYGSQQPSESSQSSSDASRTMQGCLAGSVGNYSLTDSSGTVFQLTGDTAKLQAHVGHTVQVTGTTASSPSSATTSGNQSGSMSAPSDAQPTFNVTSFKHVSTSCAAPR